LAGRAGVLVPACQQPQVSRIRGIKGFSLPEGEAHATVQCRQADFQILDLVDFAVLYAERETLPSGAGLCCIEGVEFHVELERAARLRPRAFRSDRRLGNLLPSQCRTLQRIREHDQGATCGAPPLSAAVDMRMQKPPHELSPLRAPQSIPDLGSKKV